MQINISDQERELLVRILEDYYSTLREEVYKTETYTVKDDLKNEESAIRDLLGKLQVIH
jgi:hypothetical protein